MVEQEQNKMNQEKKDLFMQLHGQYYADNQSRMNTLITIIVALLAVIGAYGYVLAYSSRLFVTKPEFTLLALLGMTAITLGVIAVLYYITLQIGLKCRMEQFVATAIREQLLGIDLHSWITNPEQKCLTPSLEAGVFPTNYIPHGKKPYNFVPNIYNDLLRIFLCTYFIVGGTTTYVCVKESCDCSIGLGILFFVGLLLFMMCATRHAFNKYESANELYKKQL